MRSESPDNRSHRFRLPHFIHCPSRMSLPYYATKPPDHDLITCEYLGSVASVILLILAPARSSAVASVYRFDLSFSGVSRYSVLLSTSSTMTERRPSPYLAESRLGAKLSS